MDWEDYLKNLGAKNVLDRKDFEGESKLLEKGIWDGVDCFLCSECGENHKDWVVAISTFSIGTIILILAAMLLPSLTNAKNRARDLICTNNQRQIGLALFF